MKTTFELLSQNPPVLANDRSQFTVNKDEIHAFLVLMRKLEPHLLEAGIITAKTENEKPDDKHERQRALDRYKYMTGNFASGQTQLQDSPSANQVSFYLNTQEIQLIDKALRYAKKNPEKFGELALLRPLTDSLVPELGFGKKAAEEPKPAEAPPAPASV